jgi:hypothetical protein
MSLLLLALYLVVSWLIHWAVLARFAGSLQRWERLTGALLLTIAQVTAGQLLLGALGLLVRPASLGLQLLLLMGCAVLAGRQGWLALRGDLAATARFGARTSWGALPLVLLAVITLGSWLLISYSVDSLLWDGIGYHLPMVGRMLTTHGFAPMETNYSVIEGYPRNLEFLMAFVVQLTGWVGMADGVQIPFLLWMMLGAIGFAHARGAHPGAAVAAACLIPMSPAVLRQLHTTYIDIAVGACLFFAFVYWVSAFAEKPTRARIALSAVAAGVACGMKGGALLPSAVLAVLWLVVTRRQEGLKPARVAVTFGAPLVALGSYWYFRNWWAYGNPLYPIRLNVLGHTFPGDYELGPQVLGQMIPAEVRHLEPLERLIHAWLMGPRLPILTEFGGMGWAWSLLFLPAFIWVIARLWVVQDTRTRGLGALLLVSLLTLIVTPGVWCGRYTLFLLPVGAICFAVVLKDAGFWTRGALLAFATGIAAATLLWMVPLSNIHPYDVVAQLGDGDHREQPWQERGLATFPESAAWRYLNRHAGPSETVVVLADAEFIRFTGPLHGPRMSRPVRFVSSQGEWRERAHGAGQWLVLRIPSPKAEEIRQDTQRFRVVVEADEALVAQML